MKIRSALLISVAVLFWLGVSAAGAQTVETNSQASKMLKLENVHATPEEVSGVIVNDSPHQVRDVVVLVQYHWLWKSEFHPGHNPLGEMFTVHLDKSLAPGASEPFSYSPRASLPERHDGYYMPEVDIGAFTVMVPQTQSAER